ncbi:hypothetical protein EVAR_46232_1 [Eumeta japonica]|uniref:Uncharacterized protein n=1 Tax=Eumeta variegata TaxID=151549 RepID=A0A4C1XLX8_EUMVA|nr:hypothetical protein EVAR_46232_1 [Eumeta japonica]
MFCDERSPHKRSQAGAATYEGRGVRWFAAMLPTPAYVAWNSYLALLVRVGAMQRVHTALSKSSSVNLVLCKRSHHCGNNTGICTIRRFNGPPDARARRRTRLVCFFMFRERCV